MGHSFIEYKNQIVRLHDFNVWVIRHFLLGASNDKEFSEFVENIEWVGPGVFLGTKLHEFVKDDKSRLAVLVSALEGAMDLIKSFGEFVPLSYLEKNINQELSYFMTDQPTDMYVQDVKNILSVISNVESIKRNDA